MATFRPPLSGKFLSRNRTVIYLFSSNLFSPFLFLAAFCLVMCSLEISAKKRYGSRRQEEATEKASELIVKLSQAMIQDGIKTTRSIYDGDDAKKRHFGEIPTDETKTKKRKSE